MGPVEGRVNMPSSPAVFTSDGGVVQARIYCTVMEPRVLDISFLPSDDA